MDQNSHSNPPERIRLTPDIPQVNPYQQKMPEVGSKVGPHEIRELIGEGGAAAVFKTWHTGLEVARALKVLKSSSNKESRERFLTEAKILADIHHPNIVQIHTIGYWEREVPFIEMEHVDGASVKKFLSQTKRLPVPVALAVGYFVCQAMHYAHNKDYTLYGQVYHGLIHRDIKPDNIYISRNGIIKLMDFGIARPADVSLHTVGQNIMGTLAYLSPEQLNAKSLDHRTDIFSLGAVVYEMITGVMAFPQRNISELVQKKASGQFRPVDSFDVPVPKSVRALIEKSMALDPAQRFADAAELGQALFTEMVSLSARSPQDHVNRFVKNPAAVESDDLSLGGSPAQQKTIWVVAAAALGLALLICLLKIVL